MIVIQKYRICKKCGISGGKFGTRKHKLKNGKVIHYVASSCVVCEREDARIRHNKIMLDPEKRKKKLEANRNHKCNNRPKVRESGRKYYRKNKERIRIVHQRYYEQNKERILAQCREYRANRPKKYKRLKRHIWDVMETQRIGEVIHRKQRHDSLAVC